MTGQPAPRPPFITPGASPLRRAVEQRSAVVLLFLRSLPRPVPPLLVVALLVGGLLLEGIAAACCLALILVLFTWLLFLSWPALAPPARLVRIAVIGLIAFAVVSAARS